VFADAAGVRDPATEARMNDVFARVAQVPGVTGVESPYSPFGARQVSKDGTVAYATVDFAKRDNQITTKTTDAIERVAFGARQGALHVELGGNMFQSKPALGATELIGIIAAIIILLVVFGSVLAMGLPIMTALAGIGIGLALVEMISQILSTPNFATELASMIGIGVGIDYALFIVTRYRQGLQEGLEPEPAVVRAIDTSGRAVVFAGTTVMISVLGLYLMGVSFVQGLAVGTSLTVALVMLAAITLLPAVLGFAGRKIDTLSVGGRKTREGHTRDSVWFRWSRVVQRRPWPALLGTLVILGVLAVPLFSLRMGFSDAGGNPTSDTTRQAYDTLARGFGPGFNGPLTLAAEFPPGTTVADLSGLVVALRETPGVAAVGTPVMSPGRTAAVIEVIPTTSPQAVQTTSLVTTLRDRVVPDAVRGSPVVVHVGGITAATIDVSNTLSSRLPLFIGAVLALSFLLLLAVFRSVLVPLKAVIMNLLSIGAAYGVIVAVFQWGWLASVVGISKTGPIAPFIPMMMFAITFGLSMDYELFLLSRIREEYDRTHDNALAVADGLAATARVITAAALIMVTVFLSFVTGAEPTLKLFGLGLAAAIFIDATLVRMVLVPATMELLGDRNWWFPHWLDRVVPRLHVEATPAPAAPAPPDEVSPPREPVPV
ncbi:MAG TPA: MMPL family transporter, partial [Acidimicrobiia bacterium]|nr:MMPL family transporter [Acidimicrobiia bacterium]